MAEKKKKLLKVVSPAGVAAYAWIARPDSGQKYSDDKYKITLVLDPDDPGIAKMEKTIKEAAVNEWGKVPKDLKTPFTDGDDKDKAEFKGKVLVIAKSKFQPAQYDAKRNELPDGVRVMSGDVVKFSALCYPYEKTEKVKEGKKTVNVKVYGVSLQLRAVQLIEKRATSDASGDFDDEEGFDSSALARANRRKNADDDDSDDDDAPF